MTYSGATERTIRRSALEKGNSSNSPVPAHRYGEPVGIPFRSVQEKAVSVMRKWSMASAAMRFINRPL